MMAIPARPVARTTKQPQDTVAGCRSRAEADLLASVAMSTPNERIRLETSAASWAARGDLLQRCDDNHAARKLALTPDATSDDDASCRP